MLKRFFLALAFAGLLSPAYSAGTVPGYGPSQQLDNLGKPLANCFLFTIQAGTVSTPQNAYQDSGLTLVLPNPQRCDAAGRIGQFFLADGSIKIRLTDRNGVNIITNDGILVVGASSGGGGGSPVDPTTIMATGDIKVRYDTSIVSGFVRANGRTIGSATSGATERANSDCQALFQYLWGDGNLVVSSGRGVSAIADWAANKTIALPDMRGKVIAGLDDMGNTAAGRLTATYFGTAATVLGVSGGNEKMPGLATVHLPAYTPAGTITNGAITPTGNTAYQANTGGVGVASGGGVTVNAAASVITSASQAASTFTGNAQGGTSTPFALMQPTIVMTYYLKL